MEPEVQGYLTEFNILRGQVRDAIRELDEEAVNWRPLPGDTNSIYAILCHLIGSENYWMRQVIGGETVRRDRDAEFQASGQLPELMGSWEEAGKETEKILGRLSPSQLEETRATPIPDLGPVTVRWCILHQISHHAIHLGHIQLTRQLWEQQVSSER